MTKGEFNGQFQGYNSDDIPDEEERKRQDKIMQKYRELQEIPFYSDNIFMEMNVANLKNFYQRAISELQDARNLFSIRNMKDENAAVTPPLNARIQVSDIRVQFEELCYISKVTNFEVCKYFEMLRQRVRDIEQTIDHHFELIKPALRKDKMDKIERSMKREREEKDKLRKAAKNQQGQIFMEQMKTARSATNRSQSNDGHQSKSNTAISKEKH